ncbi:4129_t:CDS:2, partial [Acaulospora morrowiae]
HEWEREFYAVKSGSWCLQCSWDGQKVGLQVAKEIAFSKGGECLSEVMGRWCKICSKEKRKNINPKYELSNLLIAIKIAHTHGDKCLSSSYDDNALPLIWECSKGHRWTTSLANVKNQ